ncbi:hypothetical protein ABE425_15635 [Chryseobacterium cucumeris]|uniref:hypothetical protein n=1 Tax=Chryseobacterium TaxID=59732 RepID=UPI0028831647|nr:hypothetical protein [Chryseobacterium sp. SG20098]WNI36444.1 hypothetical protein RHP76_21245 [Chryseobacterium sp. SG20098]
MDLSDPDLNLNALAFEWQEFYNKKRLHFSLSRKTPWEKLKSSEHLIPIQHDVTAKFWDSNEIILPRNYAYLSNIKQKNINFKA